MVSTRRQSGVVPSTIPVPMPSRASKGGNTKSEDEEDWDSELTSDSDSGSEWGGEKRPSKRAKTESPSKSSAVVTTKRRRLNLSNIFSMPLDLLFEIFGHLKPADLLSLARTNRELRALLMSKKSISVWKTARGQLLAPDCPSDFSEPRWADLLFGGPNCQECGTKGVQRVDFGLRRRVCTACLKKNLVYAGSFKDKFPDSDIAVLDLIPYTNTGGWAHGHASHSKFYWKAEIRQMITILGNYMKDNHMHKPGAQQALKDFKLDRRGFVDDVVQHAAICKEWASETADERRRAVQERKHKRLRLIKERLLGLGYLEVDMSWLDHVHEVNHEHELTDRIWNRIRPAVEANVKSRRDSRIRVARSSLFDSRRQLVSRLYGEYKGSLLPLQWACLPNDDEVYKGFFNDLIEEDSDRRLEEADCADYMARLPGYLATLNEEKRQILRTLVASAKDIHAKDPNAVDAAPIDADALLTCSCRSHNPTAVFFGLEEALYHRCFYGKPKFEYCGRGYDALVSLRSLIGPSGSNAKYAELDSRDLRFVCLNCPLEKGGRRVYPWRQAVMHYALSPHCDNDTLNWKLLNEEEAAEVKSVERPDGNANEPSWMCCYCPYTSVWKTRGIIVDHLKATHKVDRPLEYKDLLYHPAKRRNVRIPPKFPVTNSTVTEFVDQSENFRCLKCPSTSTRRFILIGVKSHLQAKHQVKEPVDGQHYGRWVTKKAEAVRPIPPVIAPPPPPPPPPVVKPHPPPLPVMMAHPPPHPPLPSQQQAFSSNYSQQRRGPGFSHLPPPPQYFTPGDVPYGPGPSRFPQPPPGRSLVYYGPEAGPSHRVYPNDGDYRRDGPSRSTWNRWR